jgi:hypothetical protein
MELHAFAQPEFPGQIVDRAPRHRKRRLQLRLRILGYQRLEDMLGDVVVGREVVVMRIDRSHVRAKRDAQVGGIDVSDAREQRDGGRRKSVTAWSIPLGQARSAYRNSAAL